MDNKQRIDHYLVKNNYCKTRTQALELIKNGFVFINDNQIKKNNLLIDSNQEIKIIYF